jgi:hypothetical protein
LAEIMGIASSIQKVQEGMAENMKKAQMEQREMMMKNKMLGMQKRVRVEKALAQARARENSKWTGSVLAFVITSAGIAKARTGSVPPLMAVPIVILTVSTSYLADLGWGNKIQRIQDTAKEILSEQGHGDDMPPSA